MLFTRFNFPLYAFRRQVFTRINRQISKVCNVYLCLTLRSILSVRSVRILSIRRLLRKVCTRNVLRCLNASFAIRVSQRMITRQNRNCSRKNSRGRCRRRKRRCKRSIRLKCTRHSSVLGNVLIHGHRSMLRLSIAPGYFSSFLFRASSISSGTVGPSNESAIVALYF